MAAQTLSVSGERDGLIPAAEVALDPGQDTSARARAVEPFFWFRGPEIRRLLTRVLKTTSVDQAEVRSAAYRALTWYDDDETLAVLGGGLAERDDTVRTAAQESFAFANSNRSGRWLRQNIGQMSPQAQVYAARALQLMKAGGEAEVFSGYIRVQAERSNDYAALVTAIVGLREYYKTQPVPQVIDALKDERREIRLAATLGLAERPEADKVVEALKQAATEPGSHFQLAVRRAQWAAGVSARMRTLRHAASQALSSGDLRTASNSLRRFDFNMSDETTALLMGLSVRKPSMNEAAGGDNYVFSTAFWNRADREPLLQPEIDLKRGLIGTALETLTSALTTEPAMRKSLAVDPAFEPLRKHYQFRVITGIELPKLIDDIHFPEKPVPPGKVP